MKKFILTHLLVCFTLILFSQENRTWTITDVKYEFTNSYQAFKTVFPGNSDNRFIKITAKYLSSYPENLSIVGDSSEYIIYRIGSETYKVGSSTQKCDNGSISFSKTKEEGLVIKLGQNPSTLTYYFEIPKSVTCGIMLNFDNNIKEIIAPCP